METKEPEIPLTPEAEKAGWDAGLASEPTDKELKEGIFNGDS